MDLDMFFSLLQTAMSLAAVTALAYLVLRGAKKLMPSSGNYVTIIEKTPLSNQSYLAVAKVGGAYHLISVTQGEIKILKDLDSDEVEKVIEERNIKFEQNPLDKFMQMRKNRE